MPRRKSPRRKSPRRRKTPRKSPRRRRKSTRKSRRRKSTRRKSTGCAECKRLLGVKIGANMKEGKFASRKQAIAVAYSQVRAMRPQCKKCFRR